MINVLEENIDMQNMIDELARDVIKISRNTLLVNLRFLDAALSQLVHLNHGIEKIGTDGSHFIYNPKYVLKQYKEERTLPARDYLHTLMHCIFRHMYIGIVDRDIWNLSCDIAVESTINELELKAVISKRQMQQSYILDDLKKELTYLTAEKIYAYYKENHLTRAEFNKLRGIFYGDDHQFWYQFPVKAKVQGLSPRNSDAYDDKESQSDSFKEDERSVESSFRNIDLEARWKEISERIQGDLETFSKQQGHKAGAMMQNLKEINRERYDYTKFLKKFAVLGEEMKVNDDEFDYIFYTYGLQLYKKMPLIEPLEYKDIRAIKEFVIAIDTSSSTSGALVQTFLQKTYNILKSTESFHTKINIHIIQCDATIQEHVKITKQEEFVEYINTLKIKGLGGTDFRPVFEKVEDLIQRKEFLNLNGLIYFTDGIGTFPVKKPNYHTAFIFVEDNYNNFNVPSWAMKVVLDNDEIKMISNENNDANGNRRMKVNI